MNDEAVRVLLRAGYAFPCATCAKMHRAVARGLASCEAAEKGQECAGPLSGQSFPLYEGPLTKEMRAVTCFMCGGTATHTLETRDGVFHGVCAKHLNRCVPTSSEALVPCD